MGQDLTTIVHEVSPPFLPFAMVSIMFVFHFYEDTPFAIHACNAKLFTYLNNQSITQLKSQHNRKFDSHIT